jgi:YihY family inner membrane protein
MTTAPLTGEHPAHLEPLGSRLRRFFVTAWRDNVLFMASALSFDGILTAIPLILLFFSIFGFIMNVRPEDVDALGQLLQRVFPDHGTGLGDPLAQAERLITRVIQSRAEFTLYGIPLFLVFSSRLFASTRIALDQVMGVVTKRRWRHDLVHDLGLVLIVTTMFAANAVVTVPVLRSIWATQIVRILSAFLFSTLLFFTVYSLAPTKKPRWDLSLVGALAASFTFEGSKFLFGIYLRNFVTVDRLISNANAIALMLFALWIYVVAVIFLLGGEVAKFFGEHKESRRSAKFETMDEAPGASP